jgi:hypothetical protein
MSNDSLASDGKSAKRMRVGPSEDCTDG